MKEDGKMYKYLKTCIRRLFVDIVTWVLDSSFFYEPPMNRIKTRLLNLLLGCRLATDAILVKGVKVLNWCNLSVGDYSYLANDVTIRAQNMVDIGKWVIIGPEAFISNGDHSLEDLTPSAAPIRIGDGVYVGARAMILGGVSIGDHAVIGAGAVVVRDVPPGGICVGIPGKVIKYRPVPEKVWTIFGYKTVVGKSSRDGKQ